MGRERYPNPHHVFSLLHKYCAATLGSIHLFKLWNKKEALCKETCALMLCEFSTLARRIHKEKTPHQPTQDKGENMNDKKEKR